VVIATLGTIRQPMWHEELGCSYTEPKFRRLHTEAMVIISNRNYSREWLANITVWYLLETSWQQRLHWELAGSIVATEL